MYRKWCDMLYQWSPMNWPRILENRSPFFGCCTADSQADEDQNQLNNNLKIDIGTPKSGDSQWTSNPLTSRGGRSCGRGSGGACRWSRAGRARRAAGARISGRATRAAGPAAKSTTAAMTWWPMTLWSVGILELGIFLVVVQLIRRS